MSLSKFKVDQFPTTNTLLNEPQLGANFVVFATKVWTQYSINSIKVNIEAPFNRSFFENDQEYTILRNDLRDKICKNSPKMKLSDHKLES